MFLAQKCHFCILLVWPATIQVFIRNLKKWQKLVKICRKLVIIISNNLFWVLNTNFSHLRPKKGQKTTFWIQILVPPPKICHKNIFSHQFETPKEYGRHFHRYLGKVKIFQIIWNVPKTQFLFREALKSSPLMVGLKTMFLRAEEQR